MPSVQLDGKNQYLASSSPPARVEITDTWSLSFWVKASLSSEVRSLLSIGTDERNRIDVTSTPIPGVSTAQLRVRISDASGSAINHSGWGQFFDTTVSGWSHGAITWDGTDLQVCSSGTTLTTGTLFTNVSGDMSDDFDRKVFYGSATDGNTATWSGLIGHCAIWDTVLSLNEIQEIADGGHDIDLTSNTGNYVSSDSLKQYWKPGKNPSDIGQNFAVSGTQINIGNNATNIFSGNIVEEVP